MPLTDVSIRKTKSRARSYKLSDGNGLWLYVNPNGTKYFRYRYKYLGKESTVSLGKYPEISLQEARDKRIETRRMLEQNINPGVKRKREKRLAEFKTNNTFKALAKEWYDTNFEKWTSRHAEKLWQRLELHIIPTLGERPISDITALELLDTVRRLEKGNKTETSHKVLQNCRSIFQFAVLTQKISYNPASDLKGVLKPHRGSHYPTIGHNQLPDFLIALDEVQTTDMNRLAVKLLMLTFVRQGELRRAKWADIDLEHSTWRVPAETTKMRQTHIVPLASQAVAILEQLKTISGASVFLFPSQNKQKNPIMSENTINNVIHKMGYQGQLVGHGFRAMASTILNENGGFRPDVIERQLAHAPRDKVRAAYNRADYLSERREMMEWWGELLAGLGLN